jgi:hypothetical protein
MRRTLCICGPYSQFLHRMRPRPQIHNRTFGFRTGKRQGLFSEYRLGYGCTGAGTVEGQVTIFSKPSFG